MTSRICHLLVRVLQLMLIAAVCCLAYGQIHPDRSEYNDLVTQINFNGPVALATPAARQSGGPEVLKAIDRLTPLIQARIDAPEHHVEGALLTEQLGFYYCFRLALNEPGAVASYRADLAPHRLWPAHVAVGTAVARRPPHRSRRAELPHRALALDHHGHPL